MDEVSNGQRALWTLLVTSLAAPFFAALIVLLLSLVAGALGRGPESLKALAGAAKIAWAGEKAVAAFAWSAMPAVAGGALLAGLVLVRGSFGRLEAIAAGAILSAAAAWLTGGIVAQHLAPVVMIGALVGLIMHAVLGRIVRS
jgi:hypothetical protein